MYDTIIKKIVELGDTLPAISGYDIAIEKNKKLLDKKDIEIEKELIKTINTFPGVHAVYAEELHDTFVTGENVWIIDPISNTRNFVQGIPHYSIVLSHLYKGEIKFAVVYDPSNKELFTAEKGKGAFLNGKQITVSKREKDPVVLLSSPWELYREQALHIVGALSASDSTIRIFGSFGVQYAYIACGRAEASISFNRDTFPEFAGKLLVEEAGGKFTDFNGNILDSKTRGIIATNGIVHNQIKDIVNNKK